MDDLFDNGLWAAHDLQNRLNLRVLGFSRDASVALFEVIDAVERLKQVEGWEGCNPSDLLPERLREVG